jgi:hypothetical protein
MYKPIFALFFAVAPLFSIAAQKAPAAAKNGEYATVDSLYRWRIKQERLDGIYIPKDLNDCFAVLDKAMDGETKKTFLAIPDDQVDAQTHNTIGRWMDVRWHMSEGSRLTAKLNEMGLPHYEYMISVILVSYHRIKNGRDPGVKEQVEQYQAHWEEKQAEKRREAMQKAAAKEKGK